MRIYALSLAAALMLPLSAFAESKTYNVGGMTCGSCVKAVKAQVCKLPGIETCEVEVGKVTVTGQVDEKAVTAGIQKAGFTVLGNDSQKAKE